MASDETQQGARAPKVRATFLIRGELLDEVRDAVVALSGPKTRLTLAAFMESACERELARLKDRHRGGRRFPRRAEGPRSGRPIGS